MGLFDLFFHQSPTTLTVRRSILPLAAKKEILSGRLPRINTNKLFTKQDEFCCYIEKALLLVDKTKHIYETHGINTPGFFKGNRHHWGTGFAREYTETKEFKAILYITNKRIVLQCKGHGFDKAYRYLSAIEPYSNGIELQYGDKTYSIILPDGAIAYQVIKMIQQGGSVN